ncbi:MAG TPA: phosphatase PAP2 family protein [Reyranella sp.]|nr:phosphatase PAP2 family protein [Reyranella sp.]
MRNRDGVVGPWSPPNPPNPFQLGLDSPDNLKRWEAWVRASVFDYELISRIGFTTDPAHRRVSLWHLKVTPPANPGHHPTPHYHPLLDFVRPKDEIYEGQLRFLDQYADLRADRESEVISQLGGGLWFLASVAFLHPERTKWTLELLSTAIRLASTVEMRIKQGLSVRRPVEFSPQVQPMIQTPSHGSTPSGHATESFICALVLLRLLQAAPATRNQADVHYGQQLMRIASRIAVNRTVAGVHFPVDSACGCLLGLTLAEYFVQRCTANAQYCSWHFLGDQFPNPNPQVGGAPAMPPNDGDFYWSALYDATLDLQTETDYAKKHRIESLQGDTPSIALPWLWQQAVAEWF